MYRLLRIALRGHAAALLLTLFPVTLHAQLIPDDRYTLYPGPAVVSPGDDVTMTIYIDSVQGTNGAPDQIAGWSLGFCHDALLTLDDVVHTPLVGALNGGPPSFSAITLYPTGFTDGLLIDFQGINTLPQGSGYPLYEVTYEAGMTSGIASVDFCQIGTPPVLTLVVTGSVDIAPVSMPGSIEILSEPYFIRGDCDNTGNINLADAVFLFGQLFPPSGIPLPMACDDACDCNDDGVMNISDGIWALNALLGNPAVPLPGPYPQCGPDGADDFMNCGASASGCP